MQFQWNDKLYDMQESAMYAAYAYQKQQNLISDAKRHLECFAFGSVAEALEEDVIESEKMEFYGMYGVNYDRIAENLGIIVRQYESAYTESETPASLWEQAIQKTIDVILTQQNEIASYSQLADACRYCNPGVVTLALGVLFQLGTNHISKMTSTDCIQGNLFSVEAKQEALNLARMMAKASLDVLLAVIQREVAQYEDVQGIRIPHLHPNGDKELLCPACGGNDLRYHGDMRSAEDGCVVGWVCRGCGAHGLANYKYAFDHHSCVEDCDGCRIGRGEDAGK